MRCIAKQKRKPLDRTLLKCNKLLHHRRQFTCRITSLKEKHLLLITLLIRASVAVIAATLMVAPLTASAQSWGSFSVQKRENAAGTTCECVLFDQCTVGPVAQWSMSRDECSRPCSSTQDYFDAIKDDTAPLWSGGRCGNTIATFDDKDNDGVVSGLDADDRDHTVGRATAGSSDFLNSPNNPGSHILDELRCDGIDNDADGSVDEGAACTGQRHNYDGLPNAHPVGAGFAFDPRTGHVAGSSVDVTIVGPNGPLTFTRLHHNDLEGLDGTYGSPLGEMWTHNHMIYRHEAASHSSGRTIQQIRHGSRTLLFNCHPTPALTTGQGDKYSQLCEPALWQQGGALYADGSGVWHYLPQDGTDITFHTQQHDGRWHYREMRNLSGLVAKTVLDSNGRVERVETANSGMFLHFEYSGRFLQGVRVRTTTGGFHVEYGYDVNDHLETVTRSTTTPNAVVAGTRVTYTTNLHGVTAVDAELDGSTVRLLTLQYQSPDGYLKDVVSGESNFEVTMFNQVYVQSTLTEVKYRGADIASDPFVSYMHNGRKHIDRRLGEYLYKGSNLNGNPAHFDDTALDGIGLPRYRVRAHDGRVVCTVGPDGEKTTHNTQWVSGVRVVRFDSYPEGASCDHPPSENGPGGLPFSFAWIGAVHVGDQFSKKFESRHSFAASLTVQCNTVTSIDSSTSCVGSVFDYAPDGRLSEVRNLANSVDETGAVVKMSNRNDYVYFGSNLSNVRKYESGNLMHDTILTYELASGPFQGLQKSVTRNVAGVPQTITVLDYDFFGRPVKVTDPNGVVTDVSRNVEGGVTSETVVGGLVDKSGGVINIDRTIQYNSQMQISSVTGPNGITVTNVYDTANFGRLKHQVSDILGTKLDASKFEYDGQGMMTDVYGINIAENATCSDETCTDYEMRTKRKYNLRRQAVEEHRFLTDLSDPADAIATVEFDTVGRVTKEVDFDGTERTYTYNSQGRLTDVEDTSTSNTLTETYSYDIVGRVEQIVTPGGVVTESPRNDMGKVVKSSSPTTGDVYSIYDGAGRLVRKIHAPFGTSRTDPQAEHICYNYHEEDELASIDVGCENGPEWVLDYNEDHSQTCGLPASGHKGRLTSIHGPDHFERRLCYHPNGTLAAVFQMDGVYWDDAQALGERYYYNKAGNIQTLFTHVTPASNLNGREIEYIYGPVRVDKVHFIRHRLVNGGSWEHIISTANNPQFDFGGGYASIEYANGTSSTLTRNLMQQPLRKTVSNNSGTTLLDIELEYDANGHDVIREQDHGVRHLDFHYQMDSRGKLRCVSRSPISPASCPKDDPVPGFSPRFIETFDYSENGSRTYTQYAGSRVQLNSGGFPTDDTSRAFELQNPGVSDRYAATHTPDIGASPVEVESRTHDFKGNTTYVSMPFVANEYEYTYDVFNRLKTSRWNAGMTDTTYSYSEPDGRLVKKDVSPAGTMVERYFFSGGSSPNLSFTTTESVYAATDTVSTYIWLAGFPVYMVESERDPVTHQLTDIQRVWIHTDMTGTPVLLTNDVGEEAWRWEKDPFGKVKPIERPVHQDDTILETPNFSTSKTTYATCCCVGAFCNVDHPGCAPSTCSGGTSIDMAWSHTFTAPSGAVNVRVHFSGFDLEPGDRVDIVTTSGDVVYTYEGDMGDFWSGWIMPDHGGVSGAPDKLIVELWSDNVTNADGTGFTVDAIEWQEGPMAPVMLLRMPGQLWDSQAGAMYNGARWYNPNDGRFLSPDPIGLAGGARDYYEYANSNPVQYIDPTGLQWGGGGISGEWCPSCPTEFGPGSAGTGGAGGLVSMTGPDFEDFFQRLGNWLQGEGFKSNAQVAADRQRILEEQRSRTPGERRRASSSRPHGSEGTGSAGGEPALTGPKYASYTDGIGTSAPWIQWHYEPLECLTFEKCFLSVNTQITLHTAYWAAGGKIWATRMCPGHPADLYWRHPGFDKYHLAGGFLEGVSMPGLAGRVGITWGNCTYILDYGNARMLCFGHMIWAPFDNHWERFDTWPAGPYKCIPGF